jgi:hypothetical protein
LNGAVESEGRRVVNNIKALLEGAPPEGERPPAGASGGRA